MMSKHRNVEAYSIQALESRRLLSSSITLTGDIYEEEHNLEENEQHVDLNVTLNSEIGASAFTLDLGIHGDTGGGGSATGNVAWLSNDDVFGGQAGWSASYINNFDGTFSASIHAFTSGHNLDESISFGPVVSFT